MPKGTAKILMLPRFSRKGANSRYRLWQYVPLFERAGYTVEVRPMLDDLYLDHLYQSGKRSVASLIKGYLRQLRSLLSVPRYQAVLLDQELVPYMPSFIEELACNLNRRVIVDYDDAAYWKYEKSRLFRGRIASIMGAACSVVVGNHYLEDYARKFARAVWRIPTVVDVAKYPVRDHLLSKHCVRICWIGTPITASRYLPAVLPVFRALQRSFPQLLFRFIGSGDLKEIQDLNVETVEWSEGREADDISKCDIGVMPLPDTEFERGKCGLKLIQYMAAGLPVIASPVGENRFIVRHGITGYLSSSPEEWQGYLECLIADRSLRAKMGAEGRQKVESCYSLAYGFEQWQALFREIC